MEEKNDTPNATSGGSQSEVSTPETGKNTAITGSLPDAGIAALEQRVAGEISPFSPELHMSQDVILLHRFGRHGSPRLVSRAPELLRYADGP